MTKSKDHKSQRAELLGMPYGTAERKLRKAVIYELAHQTGKNFCIDCGQEIESPDDLALVHVEDWQEDPDQFFDLTNVAFSHASCKASRGGRRQEEENKMRRVEVTVEDTKGRALPGVSHQGTVYVAGGKGQRYQIRVRNTTNRRLLVVTTVDGRNVNTGKPGDVNDSGHVLDPWQEWTFEGWRQSDDRVAAFRFGAKKEAYSSQMGSPENVGVIGLAVFEEDVPAPRIITVKEREYVPYPVPRPYPYVPYPWPRPWVDPWKPYVQPYWSITTTDTVTYGSGGTGGTFTSGGMVGSAGGAGSSAGGSGISGVSSVFSVSGSSPQGATGGVGGTGAQFDSLDVSFEEGGGENVSFEYGSSKGKQAKLQKQQLGTEYGESVISQVRSTSFKRATEDPVEVHEIRYDSMKALRARGIMGRKPSQKRRRKPQAFPKTPEVQGGYCPPPPRRRAYKT